MKKGLIRKGLVLSVIILFIGVGIQPVFAGESITSTLDKEEDCIECQVSDRINLLRAKILLFKVKVITNIILSSKLGEIPEIEESCQELLDVIDLNSPLDWPIICINLWIISASLDYLWGFLEQITEILWRINPDLADEFYDVWIIMINIMIAPVFWSGVFFGCWEFEPPYSNTIVS